MENNLPENVEKDMVELLMSGDKKAFEKLYKKYKNKLYYYCFSILSISDVAEDIVQEVFIKVWENRKSLCSELSFSSYLFTIAHNKIVSYLRRCQTEQHVISQWLTGYSKSEEPILSDIIFEEYKSFVKKTTENLPPKRKLVFQLSREEGLTHKEIASQLGISVYTVQEHISESLVHFKFNLLKHPDIGAFISKYVKVAEAS